MDTLWLWCGFGPISRSTRIRLVSMGQPARSYLKFVALLSTIPPLVAGTWYFIEGLEEPACKKTDDEAMKMEDPGEPVSELTHKQWFGLKDRDSVLKSYRAETIKRWYDNKDTMMDEDRKRRLLLLPYDILTNDEKVKRGNYEKDFVDRYSKYYAPYDHVRYEPLEVWYLPRMSILDHEDGLLW